MTARSRKALTFAVATAVLVGVFMLYTRPDMMVTLGDMIWACFQ
jgi:hypothetical protein